MSDDENERQTMEKKIVFPTPSLSHWKRQRLSVPFFLQSDRNLLIHPGSLRCNNYCSIRLRVVDHIKSPRSASFFSQASRSYSIWLLLQCVCGFLHTLSFHHSSWWRLQVFFSTLFSSLFELSSVSSAELTKTLLRGELLWLYSSRQDMLWSKFPVSTNRCKLWQHSTHSLSQASSVDGRSSETSFRVVK